MYVGTFVRYCKKYAVLLGNTSLKDEQTKVVSTGFVCGNDILLTGCGKSHLLCIVASYVHVHCTCSTYMYM